MSERLVTVAWIENDVDPEVGFIGVIAHDREIEGSYAVVRRSDHESLLAERDATIAQQAGEIGHLTVERDEARRTVRMAHEGGTKLSEQLAALAEQNENLRKALTKWRYLDSSYNWRCGYCGNEEGGEHKEGCALSLPNLSSGALNQIRAEKASE